MRAVILAGGKGTRLAPFTSAFPKPLVPIGTHPILEIILRQLQAEGFKHVTLAVGYLSELIRAYLQQKEPVFRGLKIDYVSENQPTGTAGSLASVPGLRGEDFLVMNGDVLTTLDFGAMIKSHRARKAALTIATAHRSVNVDLGVLEISDGLVTGYREKPKLEYEVSTGVYLYTPRVLDFIREGEYLDFPDLVLQLLAAGETVASYASDCLWLDIGRPDDYERAVQLYETNKSAFFPAGIDDPNEVENV